MYIDKDTARAYQECSDLWKSASDVLSKIEMILCLEIKEGGRPLDVLYRAQEVVAENAYMFSPQSEWCGNDSNGDPIFKTRKPHICE